jgi:hypothetical protein
MNIVPLFPFYLRTGFIFRKGKPFEYLIYSGGSILKNRYIPGQGSIYWKIPPPLGGGGKISADVIWGKKYEKVERKRGENIKEKGRKGKEK